MDAGEIAETPENVALVAAKAGDSAAMEQLLAKYRVLVRVRARSYFIVGGDRDDIIQEGMIGLYKAIRDFRPEKQTSFRVFAELCITRQIITAIKSATRQKHVPLNRYVSLNKPAFHDDGERTLIDVLESAASRDPGDIMVKEEFSESVRERMECDLSELESMVLGLYLEGKSYGEMSVELARRSKSIDNALQRIKRKIEKNLAGLILTDVIESS